MFSKLFKNQRYVFYKKSTKDCGIKSFRANYIDTIGNTLRVFDYEDDENKLMYNKHIMRTMPLEWIVKIETLDEITNCALLLPSDILLEIDNYV